MGFLVHGRHAQILARVFGVRSEDRRGGVGGGGGSVGEWAGEEKYSFTVLMGRRITVLQ